MRFNCTGKLFLVNGCPTLKHSVITHDSVQENTFYGLTRSRKTQTCDYRLTPLAFTPTYYFMWDTRVSAVQIWASVQVFCSNTMLLMLNMLLRNGGGPAPLWKLQTKETKEQRCQQKLCQKEDQHPLIQNAVIEQREKAMLPTSRKKHQSPKRI